MEPKSQDVHDVQTTLYTEARGCLFSATCFRPITRGATLPKLLQMYVPCNQGNMGVETDTISLQLQCLHILPQRHYENTLVKPLGPPEGPVVNIPR